ncbi:Trehalose/maltose ABC transporter membrane spanning protein (plasmid) [Neorhizobium galegae bv. officinalis bv. officinalis str. HAMBI 1141]|uniref:Trehalose/maltose ABC transporter membrane spanning protein n=1 Tax=Neorhizobium galegae bv. officinalis bv. officinalis str. HAMBI 1141 TaxID=1028801 RepID=A0A068THD2_NEOGA|nr:sugar ABC transporter permease [Neorhizobium galegae]CDN57529.1 Trehalose/maltose ABC transporter membrane spanning protein [Neorhizobium galegae bv. officinalis bv. officinalis str. HAMBI 1141]
MSANGLKNRNGLVKLLPYAFILPPMIYLVVFMFWPLSRQMYMSLTNTRIVNPNRGRFIGLGNYERLIEDPAFYVSLKATLVYTVLTVLIGVALGVVAALAIDRPFKGRAVVRAILLFGWAVPGVAASLIWLWMYNERSGVFNRITELLGIGRFSWLTSTDYALGSVLAVTVWQVAPFVMLVVLAALQSVPQEVREAARIDGADGISTFRAVTLPHIRPSIQLAALLVAVWSIRRFDIIYLLTGGGPLGSTSTLVVKLRQTAFEGHELGMASAYGAVGLALALMVAAVHYTVEQRRMKRMSQ